MIAQNSPTSSVATGSFIILCQDGSVHGLRCRHVNQHYLHIWRTRISATVLARLTWGPPLLRMCCMLCEVSPSIKFNVGLTGFRDYLVCTISVNADPFAEREDNEELEGNKTVLEDC